MAPETRQPQDHVLAPGEYLYALDNTKAIVGTYVGPHTLTASGNLTPVIWSDGHFVRKDRYDEVTQQFVNIPEGSYLELTNPAVNPDNQHPKDGPNTTGMPELSFGRRVVIAGPAHFALWPRQTHKVIEGHQLRTNQYLLVRVSNDAEAVANWAKAVIKKAAAESKLEDKKIEQKESTAETIVVAEKAPKLTTGQLMIIKGTEVSFYIPPTGIEVVPGKDKNYVRDAVTLERMEFCILKSESGEKRFVQGPDVVFPSPTETFVEIDGQVKFRAIELTLTSGLYIKVIADYEEGEDEHKVSHKKGDELFITGKQQAIYYPRPEHNIIKYGEQTVHHAVAVPSGEGRYVLNRETGVVRLVKGPIMLLPDPRFEVIVRRVLDQNQVTLYYPGNTTAAEINRLLKSELETTGIEVESSRTLVARSLSARGERSPEAFAGDTLNRGTAYAKPRTITLDTKYDGAVGVGPYPGFSILVANKSGERHVVEGPAAILLEYNEYLVPMELSTGTPKTDKNTLKTVYLQVKNNRVSDKVEGVETKDLVAVDITLAYRVNFEGNDKLLWFQVDNYVRHLTEHARSMLRGAVKQVGIEEFYQNPIVIIRNALLGPAVEGSERKGLVFKENGMRVYDVDVLDVVIKDPKIATLLEGARSASLQTTLAIAAKEMELGKTKRVEVIEREIANEQATTRKARADHRIADIQKELETALETLKSQADQDKKKLEAEQERQEGLDAVATAKRERQKLDEEQRLLFLQKEIEQELSRMAQETKDIVERAGAVDEKFIAALQAFSDKDLLAKAAEAMAPLAIFRNSGVVEALAGLFKGVPLANALKTLSVPR